MESDYFDIFFILQLLLIAIKYIHSINETKSMWFVDDLNDGKGYLQTASKFKAKTLLNSMIFNQLMVENIQQMGWSNFVIHSPFYSRIELSWKA